MIQGGSGLCFALESRLGMRILSNLVGEELQGDKTAQFYVLGLVDHTHPAAAQLLDDAEVGNRSPRK